MRDIPLRVLRNDVSSVLRRVEQGERLRVTVGGRLVAQLLPLPDRPETRDWQSFFGGGDRWCADSGLRGQLAELLPGTTDDLPIP
ncbi:MAG: type II toxin-antitoxin system Phd/YefM family antitoxin [Candidatus Dormibacteria bacterium]